MINSNFKIEVIDLVHRKVFDMLSLTEVDDDKNLIEIGLSSIMIMQISNILRKYGLKIPFSRLIEKPTLGEWNEMINASDIKQSKKSQGSSSANKNIDFDLTDVQYAYFIGRDDEQPLGGVGCHAYMEIDGEHVDKEKLKTAWNAIQNYHPMLRAKFLKKGKQIILLQPYSEEVEVFDFAKLPQVAVEKELLFLRNALSHRKLRVELGEVAGISLALLPEGKTKIFLDVDLLVADVLSLSIIIHDLAKAYSGKEFIHKPEYTFQNYIENKINDKKEMNEDKKFWENKISQLSGELLNIPLAKKPELISKTRFSRRKNIIDKETWSEIKRISAKHKSTPSMLLLTCYALILERWCNQDAFLINIPLFNRNTENETIKNMVADFTNLLLLDYSRKPNEVFLNTMNRIKDTFLENVMHSGYSGVSVQRDRFKLLGSTGFVAPIVFACNIDTPLETDLSREVFGDISYMVSQTPQVWLDFQTYIKDDSLILCWDAVDELYPDSLLDDMFNALVELINTLAKNDDWNIEIDVLPDKHREQRKIELDKILPLQYPEKLLITDFLENTKKNPENIAVMNGITGKEISYSELYDKAMHIADLLVEGGVKPGDYIGITLPRGQEQIYAIMGILFVGAVYVPIGVNQPKDRRIKIYQQIGINSIVTNTETLSKYQLTDEGIVIMNMDDVLEETVLKKPILVSPKDSAYVIMTSGSTGVPKGVEICHESAMNTIDDINRRYNISAKDTVLMVSAIDFDLSVYDIFGMLSVGGRFVILYEINYKDPDLWLVLIEKYNISIWNSVPMLFDMLVTRAEGKGRNININVAMLSGDWIARELPLRFYNKSESSIVVAMGGATEASIWSNYLNVPKEIPAEWTTIPYGKALNNQIYRVVDDFGRICPNNVTGELWIGGVGVAKGYRGDEELTKRKYIIDTIKWYKTGDMGRIWSDGTIEFIGRKDNQVKIKGYRMELGEIESALEKNPCIADAIVCVTEKSEEKQLAAYIVLKDKMEIGPDKIKSGLENFLPSYMIPEKFYFSDKMPLMDNGKPDKKEIQKIMNERKDSNTIAPPQNPLEIEIEKIWKEVLRIEKISRFENFFKLGGDSLKAVAIITKIETIVNVPINISIRLLFKAPTIQSFALEIDKLNNDFEVEAI